MFSAGKDSAKTIKKRILTGDRPTGRLHLGHYVGSIANRVKLQYEYEEYVLIADVQALTTNFSHPEKLAQDVREVAMDNLACGLNSEAAVLCVQSKIIEIFELAAYFSMFTTVSSLKRNPTIKTEASVLGMKENIMYGFLGYPVSQAADIAIFKAHLVPVGEDQMPIIEQTREIVRKFNNLYKEILIEPRGLVGEYGRLVGTDGQAKMSKSLGNVIYLSDAEKTVDKKVSQMFTDPQKIHLHDKGNPQKCPVYGYQTAFNLNKDETAHIKELCLAAKKGCVDCKKKLGRLLNDFLDPIREKRLEFEKRPDLVDDILVSGTKKARSITQETIEEVREAMKINYFKS